MQALINQLNFNYNYLLELVKEVSEKDMTFTPAKGLENHPAFTIGHLITAYGLTIQYLGGPYTIKKEWDDLFRRRGPGDPRMPELDRQLYPKKEALLSELKVQHESLLIYLEEVPSHKWNEKIDWRFSSYFPKTIDLIHFMVISHYSMHISQLAAWRRAMDLPSALARM